MFFAFKVGLLLSLSLIISIGSQNLFVIKQGLRREYPYWSALGCFLSDFGMIVLGSTGINVMILKWPFVKISLLLLGVIFLGWYGLSGIKQSFNKAAINKNLAQLGSNQNENLKLSKLILLALSFSLLNPQALLDTLVIIGGNANYYSNGLKYCFILGSITASFLWFFGLAISSRFFSKKLFNIRFWCGLEFISGILMVWFAIKFLVQLVTNQNLIASKPFRLLILHIT